MILAQPLKFKMLFMSLENATYFSKFASQMFKTNKTRYFRLLEH